MLKLMLFWKSPGELISLQGDAPYVRDQFVYCRKPGELH